MYAHHLILLSLSPDENNTERDESWGGFKNPPHQFHFAQHNPPPLISSDEEWLHPPQFIVSSNKQSLVPIPSVPSPFVYKVTFEIDEDVVTLWAVASSSIQSFWAEWWRCHFCPSTELVMSCKMGNYCPTLHDSCSSCQLNVIHLQF